MSTLPIKNSYISSDGVTAGWVLTADGSGAVEWAPGGGSLPVGGTTGQVLTKASDADGDADWEPAGGAIQTRESFSATTAVDTASFTELTWTKSGGDDLLDLSDPAEPQFLVAGVYCVTCYIVVENDGALDPFNVYVELDFDENGDDPFIAQTYSFGAEALAGNPPSMTISFTFYSPGVDDDTYLAVGVQHDTGDTQNFILNGYIQRLT